MVYHYYSVLELLLYGVAAFNNVLLWTTRDAATATATAADAQQATRTVI